MSFRAKKSGGVAGPQCKVNVRDAEEQPRPPAAWARARRNGLWWGACARGPAWCARQTECGAWDCWRAVLRRRAKRGRNLLPPAWHSGEPEPKGRPGPSSSRSRRVQGAFYHLPARLVAAAEGRQTVCAGLALQSGRSGQQPASSQPEATSRCWRAPRARR